MGVVSSSREDKIVYEFVREVATKFALNNVDPTLHVFNFKQKRLLSSKLLHLSADNICICAS